MATRTVLLYEAYSSAAVRVVTSIVLVGTLSVLSVSIRVAG